LAMYVSRIFGHVSRHEIHKALQCKDPLPRTPVKMYLLVSKSGQTITFLVKNLFKHKDTAYFSVSCHELDRMRRTVRQALGVNDD
jgi:fructose 1,6-bisphosphatase